MTSNWMGPSISAILACQFVVSCTPTQPDVDGDGYTLCDLTTQDPTTPCDCDDQDPAVNPTAEEIIDGIDNNCDGLVDQSGIDNDNDGYDICLPIADGSEQPSKLCDCDDTSILIFPGATEHPDSSDNDCDDAVDEGVRDDDADGFTSCGEPSAQHPCDCNDSDPTLYPGAEETIPEIDQDCDGQLEWVRLVASGTRGIDNHPDGGYYLANDGSNNVQHLNAVGEVVWSTAFSTPDGAIGNVVSAAPDGSALIAGSSDGGALIAEINPQGGQNWTLTHTFEGEGSYKGTTIRGLQPLSDSTIVIGPSISGSPDDASPAWVARFSSDWSVEWEELYGGYEFDETHVLSVSRQIDGDLGLAGYQANPDSDYFVPWVVKTDRYGTEQWTHVMTESPESGLIVGVFPGDSGSFVTIGSIWRNIDNRLAIEVNEISPDGDLIYRNRLRGPEHRDVVNSVLSTNDGGYIAIGQASLELNEALLFLKIDSSFEQDWQTEIDPEVDHTTFSIFQAIAHPDGGYLLRLDYIDRGSSSTTQRARFLVKTDSKGNSPLLKAISDWYAAGMPDGPTKANLHH